MRLNPRHHERDLDDSDIDSCLSNLHRLQAVESAGILDKPPRPQLDAISQEAQKALNAGIISVSILDDHRHYLAGSAGVPEAVLEQGEVDLDHTYCKYVVAMEDVLAIDNSETDPLVAHNLATTEGGLRSYLGVPLRLNGQVIGSFCAMNTEPRAWSVEDLNVLERFALEAQTHINENTEASD